MIGAVSVIKNKIKLHTKFDMEFVLAMRELTFVNFNRKTKEYTLPLNPYTAQLVNGWVDQYNWAYSDEQAFLTILQYIQVAELNQEQGVSGNLCFVECNKRCLVTDIVPIRNLIENLTDFLPTMLIGADDTSYLGETSQYSTSRWAGFALFPTDIVAVDYKDEHGLQFCDVQRFNSVIFYNCDALKSHKTKRYRRIKGIMDQVMAHRHPYVLMMGADLNDPALIYPLLGLTKDFLPCFGNWNKFATHFCSAQKQMYGWKLGAAKHLDELQQMLITNGRLFSGSVRQDS